MPLIVNSNKAFNFSRNDRWTDIVIKCGSGEVRVHKLFLAVHSDFFKHLLSEDSEAIIWPDLTEDMFPDFLPAIYSFRHGMSKGELEVLSTLLHGNNDLLDMAKDALENVASETQIDTVKEHPENNSVVKVNLNPFMFGCDICGQNSNTNSELYNHKKTMHEDSNPVSLVDFDITNDDLDEGKYVVEVRNTKEDHVEGKQTKLEYVCEICGKRCERKGGLTKHMRAMHG